MRKKYLNYKIVLFLLFLVFTQGCASRGSLLLRDLDRPLTELQKITELNMPVKLLRTSTNAREFYSDYFTSENGAFVASPQASPRYQAKVVILGARRPYKMTIQVIAQERVAGSKFRVVGQDQGLARVIMRRIQKTLHERREDHNIIDDFRVF